MYLVDCLCKSEVNMKSNQKHLSLSDRILIEQGLNEGKTFVAIADMVDKDPTTISKEVRKHRTIKYRKDTSTKLRCKLHKECVQTNICSKVNCNEFCKYCSINCRGICPIYKTKECGRLNKAPYVCNSCKSLVSCRYDRWIYVAKYADDRYREILSSSREGINQTPESMQELDKLVSPLILKGQSLSHIFATHSKEISCSRRTLYKYIDKKVFTARNIDLPRKVKYKPRKKSCKDLRTNREYRKNKTYVDFTKLLEINTNTQVVEMDTVEGQKGGKVLLTMLFRNSSFMLAFLMDEKSQNCVNQVFNLLQDKLGIEVFKKLFPVILTDNGAEFQNPNELMCDKNGEIRTNIYYCDSNCSWQKAMIEKNHVYIRYVVPKGRSFDQYNQEQITLMINHINSTARDSLNGCTPYKLSQLLLDNALHSSLSLQEVNPDNVMLKPALLK